MARNFYYGSDTRVVGGSKNFAARLVADAEAYGIPQQRADDYAALDALLQEAFRAATTPETRTPVAVARKNELMRDVQREAAALARVASGTQSVNDAQLIELGLQPRATRAARVMATMPPTVRVESVVGRAVTVRIDARTAEGVRMPAAAAGAYVYAYVGERPATDRRQFDFCGLAPRQTYEIRFGNDVASGATAWVCCAWVSRRGEVGPACQPVRFTIQGGAVLPGAA